MIPQPSPHTLHPGLLNPQPSSLNRRIGIFGGSFNPVHLGHTALAAYICEQGLVDEVWMMVSPQNPLKQNLELLDEQHRLAMLRLAVAPYPTLQACDFEFHLPRPSYTYHTLQALREAYPEHTFSLIIGEDNWQNFHRWYRGEDILSETPIIVYPRNSVEGEMVEGRGLRVERKKVESKELRVEGTIQTDNIAEPPLPLNPQPSTLKLLPYSSTEVRNAIAAGEPTTDMLHPDVEAYIKRHGFYVK